MSAILLIDKGNTATKAFVCTPSGERLHDVLIREGQDDKLLSLAEIYDVSCGAVCNVARQDVRLLETLRRLLPGGLLVLTPDTPLPLTVRYASPRTLGADRMAAACGAASLFPERTLLIADAGTALTLDVVKDGAFCGGNICAGVRLRLQALHEHTAALPLVEADGPVPEFGYDTVTALRSGAVRGVAADILSGIDVLRDADPAAMLLLTGGDMKLLAPLLPTETICRSGLVPLGLLSILKHNEYI